MGGNTSKQSIGLMAPSSGSGKGAKFSILNPVKESTQTQLFGGGSTHCREQNVEEPSVITQHTSGKSSCCMRQLVPKESGKESVQLKLRV